MWGGVELRAGMVTAPGWSLSEPGPTTHPLRGGVTPHDAEATPDANDRDIHRTGERRWAIMTGPAGETGDEEGLPSYGRLVGQRLRLVRQQRRLTMQQVDQVSNG